MSSAPRSGADRSRPSLETTKGEAEKERSAPDGGMGPLRYTALTALAAALAFAPGFLGAIYGGALWGVPLAAVGVLSSISLQAHARRSL